MHTYSSARLFTDDQLDYTVLDVSRRGDDVALTFERKYDTCDVDDYLIDVRLSPAAVMPKNTVYLQCLVLQTGTTHILVFLENNIADDVQGFDISTLDVRLLRTQLLKSQIPEPDVPSGTIQFDMRVENVRRPSDARYFYV